MIVVFPDHAQLLSNFYHTPLELTVKRSVCLTTLPKQGISVPVLNGDLVYKFKEIFGNLGIQVMLLINSKQ